MHLDWRMNDIQKKGSRGEEGNNMTFHLLKSCNVGNVSAITKSWSAPVKMMPHAYKLIFGGKICVVFKRNSSASSHCMVITAHQPSLGCTARESSENITGGGTYCVYILGCIHSNCNVDTGPLNLPWHCRHTALRQVQPWHVSLPCSQWRLTQSLPIT